MIEPIRWGVLGTGNIANKFANATQHSAFGTIAAIASRSADNAQQFQSTWNIPNAYADYESLLHDAAVEAVYIALPNHLHAEWALKAAQCGKHILCEKPLTSTASEAQQLLKALKTYPVLFAESFLYRFHPQTQKLYELIQEKAIGDVRRIDADFCFQLGLKYDNIRMNRAFAGGAIMDVGCYAVSMARLLAGAVVGKPFVEPLTIQASGYLDPITGVDLWSSALLTFENGVIANLYCATQYKSNNHLRILGTTGRIEVSNPWKPTTTETIRVIDQNEIITTYDITASTDMMGLELEHLYKQIRNGHLDVMFPAMTRDESLANMAVLDTWRQCIGLVFEQDALSM